MALRGRRPEPKIIFLISLPFTISIYLVHLLDLAFGIHTIIFIVIMAILLSLGLKIKLSQSLLTALLAVIILAAAETALVMLALAITGVEFEQVTQNTALWILYGWPHIIFIFLLALVINRWRQSRRLKNEGFDA